jgi:ABC-2 type transport system permease protein
MKAACNTMTIFKRELKGYFESPVAYVFMIVFLVLTGFMTFSVSRLYERGMADLQPFFFWHPWVYLLLVPAATMGLWAEERRADTIELLLTMPITMMEALLGKFLAAWAFLVLAIALTLPVALTTAYLGDPDVGVILSGYLGSVLLAGATVSVGMLMSCTTRSQVVSFVMALMLCLLLILSGWPPVTDLFVRWAPAWLVNTIASFSLMPHFESIQRGVIDLRDIGYYLSVMAFMITAAYVVLDSRKGA